MKVNFLLILVLITTIISTFGQKLEPISRHYKSLSELSSKPTVVADTLKFPWTDYSQGGLTNALLATHYLSKVEMESLKEKFNYPSNSSEQTKGEIKYLLNLQANRTEKEVERAKYLANIGYWPYIDLNPISENRKQNLKDLFYIGTAGLHENLTAENFPKTAQLLKNIMIDMRAVEFGLKYHFRRPRPYHLEPTMQNLQKMGSPAFPSGHTLWAFLQAFTFSELFPQNRTKFIELADEIRWSREVMGIHYPSDNEASRQIAWQMLQWYKQKPSFQKDLNEAKIEIQKSDFAK